MTWQWEHSMCSSLCACENEQSEDEGAFWLELLTPGAILATTMVVEVVDGNARVNAIANLGVGAIRGTFIRPCMPE